MAIASMRDNDGQQAFYGLGVLAVASVLSAFCLGALLSFLNPANPDGAIGPIAAGHVSDLAIHEPVYNVHGDFWLVRLEGDEILAFVPRDTRYRAEEIGCTSAELTLGNALTSRFRRGIVLWDTISPFNDMPATFHAFCSGSRFDYAGNRIYGPSPRGLDRYPVTVDDGGYISVVPRPDLIIKGQR